jgi:hypothetical protein
MRSKRGHDSNDPMLEITMAHSAKRTMDHDEIRRSIDGAIARTIARPVGFGD